MAPPDLQEFDRQLLAEASPFLVSAGFVAGADRIFRRAVEHEGTHSIQIIEFQIGSRSMDGQFTVNLAVFNLQHLPAHWHKIEGEPESPDCMSDLVQRLGFFRSPQPTLLDRLFKRQLTPHDHWWMLSAHRPKMQSAIREVLLLISTSGFDWLQSETSRAAFARALHCQLNRRRQLQHASEIASSLPRGGSDSVARERGGYRHA